MFHMRWKREIWVANGSATVLHLHTYAWFYLSTLVDCDKTLVKHIRKLLRFLWTLRRSSILELAPLTRSNLTIMNAIHHRNSCIPSSTNVFFFISWCLTFILRNFATFWQRVSSLRNTCAFIRYFFVSLTVIYNFTEIFFFHENIQWLHPLINCVC